MSTNRTNGDAAVLVFPIPSTTNNNNINNGAAPYRKMREMTRELWAQGSGAVESHDKIVQKYGENSPTLCTIYKWRREFRGGKGERQANEESEGGSPKPTKIVKKEVDKYCASCNREMSSRHYYEFHMLKVHDILLGESKPVIDFLDCLPEARREGLVFRCDACFGGELDYDTVQELQQHKLLEHGQFMRMPKWATKTSTPSKPQQNKSMKSPGSSTPSIPQLARFHMAKEMLRRDKSLPASSTLRRSARIPKPTSAMIHSLLLAKDYNELGAHRRDHPGDSPPPPPPSRIGAETLAIRGRRVRFAAMESGKIKKEEDGEKVAPNLTAKNGMGRQKATMEEEEEEPFVTILNDGRIEVEAPEIQVKKGTQKRMMSLAALDAADSLLALTSSAAGSTSNFAKLPPNLSILTTIAATILGRASTNQSAPHSVSITSPPPASTTSGGQPIFPSFKEKEGGHDYAKTVTFLTGTNLDSDPSAPTTMAMGPKKVMGQPNILKSGSWGQQQPPQGNGSAKAQQIDKTSQYPPVLQEPRKTAANKPSKQVSTVAVREPSPNVGNTVPATEAAIQEETTLSTLNTPSGTQLVVVPQDDSTWFGHSIAAQLRIMSAQMKELAKMRIQQAIFECNSPPMPTFAPSVIQQQNALSPIQQPSLAAGKQDEAIPDAAKMPLLTTITTNNDTILPSEPPKENGGGNDVMAVNGPVEEGGEPIGNGPMPTEEIHDNEIDVVTMDGGIGTTTRGKEAIEGK